MPHADDADAGHAQIIINFKNWKFLPDELLTMFQVVAQHLTHTDSLT